MSLLRPTFEQTPDVKILINIGALFDIPTGTYISGKYGESILNGGLGSITSIVGIGNNFKTTVLHYQMLSAMSRLIETSDTDAQTYDTELSIHKDRMRALTKQFTQFKDRDIVTEGLWGLTDKSIYSANKWFDIVKEYCTSKITNKVKLEQETPFRTMDGKALMKVPCITFAEIDSFTEFVTDDVLKMQNENELGDSGANTMHMRAGLGKSRFLQELPVVVTPAYHFVLMTAQIGKDIPMNSGPMAPPPTKKLQYLKNGDKLKGVTDKFTFLMNASWHAYNAAPFINQGTKCSEYPSNPDDNNKGDTDLNIVSVRNLRCKSGPTGYVLDLIVSQSEGILPSLTEFHYIKESDRYGITGTLQHYALDILPDVKLSRTSIRTKIANEPKLVRALNITSEMCQMKQFWRTMDEELMCTPKELYDSLKAMGYDWDILLNTRGWWTLNNDKHPIPFLSTKDLLCMRFPKGHRLHYHPYWLEKDDKTKIKKEFQIKKKD